MAQRWDPERYLAFADERGRPFAELLARVPAEAPSVVVDLGCGPGNLTELLAERWPEARVRGLDSSAAMVERARSRGSRVRYDVADLREWCATVEPGSVDVLVSNAALQWVPGHLGLLPALVGAVRPGGWFAMQVPGNFDEPSHTLRRELAAEPPYADRTGGVPAPDAHDAATYLRTLRGLGCGVDAWETTYLHVLGATADTDPVFTWISGTSLRPTLAALGEDLRPGYEAELKRRLRRAYPDTAGHVVLPFRRVFVVARIAG